MDKRATIALATVVGVSALGGFYWLGTRNNATPVPVYPSATALPPIDQVVRDAPNAPPTSAKTTTTTVSANPGNAPRDTVSLLPGQNGLTAQTPIADKTMTTTQVTQSGQPGSVAYVGPSGRPSLPVTPLQPGPDAETPQPGTAYTAKEISGTQTTTTSTHTVHTASTHRYHKVHKHQKAGNVHMARATKHTVMFAAKLPFRLRP
jgi:hypothetical protein